MTDALRCQSRCDLSEGHTGKHWHADERPPQPNRHESYLPGTIDDVGELHDNALEVMVTLVADGVPWPEQHERRERR